jgi:hypothetical protein
MEATQQHRMHPQITLLVRTHSSEEIKRSYPR